jgi:hypothetical protein
MSDPSQSFRYALVYMNDLDDGDTIVWDNATQRFKAADYVGAVPPGGFSGGGEETVIPADVLSGLIADVTTLKGYFTSGTMDGANIVIKAKGKTTANWASSNPVLALYELGAELKVDGTLGFKIGDGTHTWSALGYISGTGGGGGVTDSRLDSIVVGTLLGRQAGAGSTGAVQQIPYATVASDGGFARLHDLPAGTIVYRRENVGGVRQSNGTYVGGTAQSITGAYERVSITTFMQNLGIVSEDELAITNTALTAHTVASASSSTALGSSSAGSPTITASTTWPADWTHADPIYGPGIPIDTYIGDISADKTTLTLSSNPVTTVLRNASDVGVEIVSGSGTFSVDRRGGPNWAHGMPLTEVVYADNTTGIFNWRSSSLALPTTWARRPQTRWRNGVRWERSPQYPTWQQTFPLVDYVESPTRQVVAPVGPSSHHTWTGLQTFAEFMGEDPSGTPAPVRHRFPLVIRGDTQFQIETILLTAGGTGARMYCQFWNTQLPTPGWDQITTTLVTLSLTGTVVSDATNPQQGMRFSTWQTFNPDALTIAAADTANNAVLCRLVGDATVTGNPQFGAVVALTK